MNDNSSILNINLENQETNNLLSKSQDSYEIYSINGTKCKSGLLNRYNSIDISSLANGMYFVTIHNSNSILQKEQFIVNHWEIRRLSEPGKKFSLPDPFQSVLARAGIDTRYPRGETPRHEPLRLLATTGSPAHQRDYRLTMVRQQAMAWLLRRYFDGPITEEKAKRTMSFGD